MFANLLHPKSRRPVPGYEAGFVREVRPRRRPRNRRTNLLIAICWVLIAIKSVAAIWAVKHYHIPFNAMWVVIPTIVFAGLGTLVYYLRR
jgi:hypothetical protein